VQYEAVSRQGETVVIFINAGVRSPLPGERATWSRSIPRDAAKGEPYIALFQKEQV